MGELHRALNMQVVLSIALLKKRDSDSVFPGAFDRNVITSVRVSCNPYARVSRQTPFQFSGAFRSPIGNNGESGMDGQPHPDPTSMVN